MRRRRLVVFAGGSAAVVTLLVWTLLPYIFPPVYHAVDITIEYRNYASLTIDVDMVNLRALVSSRIKLPQQEGWLIGLSLGLCRVSVEERSYDSILVMAHTTLTTAYSPRVGPYADSFSYVLGLFGNNSELGDFFRGYGFPYTYVQTAYSIVSEGSVNRTLFSMTYPNGSLLLEVSAVTSGAAKLLTPRDISHASYHLRDSHNLTILHWKDEYVYGISDWRGIGHVNVTVGAESLIWKALGRTEYLNNITIYHNLLFNRIVGKIGWLHWR